MLGKSEGGGKYREKRTLGQIVERYSCKGCVRTHDVSHERGRGKAGALEDCVHVQVKRRRGAVR